MRVGTGLRNKDSATTLDKVVGTNVRHDFSTGENLRVELLLDLTELLWYRQYLFELSYDQRKD